MTLNIQINVCVILSSLILFSHCFSFFKNKPVVRFKLAFLVEISSLNLQLKSSQLNIDCLELMVIEQSKVNERNYGQVKRKINMAQFKLEKSHTLMGP